MNFFSVVDINTEQNAPLAMKEAARRIRTLSNFPKIRLLFEL